MRNLRKAVIAAAAALLLCTSVTAMAEGDISVKMNSIASDKTEYVSFGDVKPIQIDSRTMTPARAMAEAAGMTVTWDQPTQTAILTLGVNAASDKPIERYAAEVISGIREYGLELKPVSITAALQLNNSRAVIRYNFADSEGDIVPIGKDYDMLSKAVLVNDGTLMIPMRDSMEMFGLKVDWNQEELCASVTMPGEVQTPEGIGIIPNHGSGQYVGEAPKDPTHQIPTQNGQPAHGAYIGKFKITHYCPCTQCCGPYGGKTAWAGDLVPGRSIAVNPNIIPKLSWVYIDGYGLRHAEDTGGGIGEYHIDIAVPTHEIALQMGVVYRDVYYAE